MTVFGERVGICYRHSQPRCRSTYSSETGGSASETSHPRSALADRRGTLRMTSKRVFASYGETPYSGSASSRGRIFSLADQKGTSRMVCKRMGTCFRYLTHFLCPQILQSMPFDYMTVHLLLHFSQHLSSSTICPRSPFDLLSIHSSQILLIQASTMPPPFPLDDINGFLRRRYGDLRLSVTLIAGICPFLRLESIKSIYNIWAKPLEVCIKQLQSYDAVEFPFIGSWPLAKFCHAPLQGIQFMLAAGMWVVARAKACQAHVEAKVSVEIEVIYARIIIAILYILIVITTSIILESLYDSLYAKPGQPAEVDAPPFNTEA